MKKYWKVLLCLCCWVVLLLAGCKQPLSTATPPYIQVTLIPEVKISMEPNTLEVAPGQEVALSVSASGVDLTITWFVLRGTISANYGSAIIYIAPDTPGPEIIVVQVSTTAGTTRDTIIFDVVQASTPTETVTPTSTASITPTATVFEIRSFSIVKIGEPASVSGYGNYDLWIDSSVWIFLEDKNGLYYLQRPANYIEDNWWQGTIYVRSEGIFDVVAILVDPNGNQELQRWFDQNNFGGIREDEIKNLSGYRELARTRISVGLEVETGTPPPPTLTPTPINQSSIQTETVNASAIHVTVSVKSVEKRGGDWEAIVTVDVHDENHVPLSGAVVESNWGRCTTGENGSCDLFMVSRMTERQVTVAVYDVTYKNYYYNPSENHPGELTVPYETTPGNTPSFVTPPGVTVTARSTITPTPTILSSPNVTQTIQAAMTVVEENIHQANITFNKPPEQMDVDSKETIEFILSSSKSQQVLATQIVESMDLVTSTAEPSVLIGQSGGIVTIETSRVEITPRMKAVLKSQDPDAFVITEMHEGAEQVVLQDGETTWRWSITAKKEGPQTLELILYQLIKYDNEQFWPEVETFRADIVVRVTPAKKADEKAETTREWLTIIGTLVAIIVSILGIWKWFDDRKKKDKDNVMQVKIVEEKKEKKSKKKE